MQLLDEIKFCCYHTTMLLNSVASGLGNKGLKIESIQMGIFCKWIIRTNLNLLRLLL